MENMEYENMENMYGGYIEIWICNGLTAPIICNISTNMCDGSVRRASVRHVERPGGSLVKDKFYI